MIDVHVARLLRFSSGVPSSAIHVNRSLFRVDHLLLKDPFALALKKRISIHPSIKE